jgi:hypothetical protein
MDPEINDHVSLLTLREFKLVTIREQIQNLTPREFKLVTI